MSSWLGRLEILLHLSIFLPPSVLGITLCFFPTLRCPFADDCRPCPSNGYCTEGRLRCLPGFRQQRHSCVPDEEIDRIAQKLVHHHTTICQSFSHVLSVILLKWLLHKSVWAQGKNKLLVCSCAGKFCTE